MGKWKFRYKFWRVALWVTLVNIVMLGLSLAMLFYVKFPNQPYDLSTFSVGRFIFRGMVSTVFQCIIYYFTMNIYYHLLVNKGRWPQWLLWTLATLVGCFIYSVVYDLTIQKKELIVAMDISLKIWAYSVGVAFHIGVSLLAAAITKQLDEKRHQLETQKVLEQRTIRLEKEKMQADYLFLKAQVNPHFLHNTLNFLYARSLPYSNELSEGILTLSEVMRYSLDNKEDSEGKVLLTREIEHLNNIIKIQQLRFGNALEVNFEIRGETEDLRIIPFVLITIAENAFKHGELKDPSQPVKMELSIEDGPRLRFYCVNKKKTGPKELSTGLGLDNTRRRLELAYGENYHLYIKDQRELYTVDLIINL